MMVPLWITKDLTSRRSGDLDDGPSITPPPSVAVPASSEGVEEARIGVTRILVLDDVDEPKRGARWPCSLR
jgi:hypothetical protein